MIVIEPDGLVGDGSFVLANPGGERIFRQIVETSGRWQLSPLNPRYPAIDLEDLSAVRGVVMQRTTPGRRKSNTRYGG